MRLPRPLLLATLTTAPLALAGCSRLVFEPVPSTPEAILAFRLRTLEEGRVVRIQHLDGSLAEGKVVEPGPERAILVTEAGRDTIPAREVGSIWVGRAEIGPAVARSALGAGLGAAIVIAMAYGVAGLGGPDDFDNAYPIWYFAPLVAKWALAGGVFGAVVNASSPAWNRVYPTPPGGRP